MKKNIALILAAALVLPTVIAAGGCGANSGVSNSAEATAENPMVLTPGTRSFRDAHRP